MAASANLRKEIDELLVTGNREAALAGLHRFWAMESNSAAARYVISCCEKLRPSLGWTPCRLAILRSFTLEPVTPLVRAAGFLGGLDITVHMSGFDTYAQQILDPASELYAFEPGTVILAAQTRDVLH